MVDGDRGESRRSAVAVDVKMRDCYRIYRLSSIDGGWDIAIAFYCPAAGVRGDSTITRNEVRPTANPERRGSTISLRFASVQSWTIRGGAETV
jgi:hypothetical protein